MQFQKTKIKFLNRILKLTEINKIEIAHCQIEQNLMKFLFIIVYYHHILLTTARYCTWSYALTTFCWTVVFSHKHFCTFWFRICLEWVVVQIKTENTAFWGHRMLLGFISSTTVHSNWPKLAPDFAKTWNRIEQLKTNYF